MSWKKETNYRESSCCDNCKYCEMRSHDYRMEPYCINAMEFVESEKVCDEHVMEL